MFVHQKRDRVPIAVAVALTLVAAAPALAQRSEPVPPQLKGVGITEHLGAQVPLDLQFTAEDGSPVKLSSLIDGKRPVILTLVYYRCPMLCGLVLKGLAEGMSEVKYEPAKDFEIVTVSFNPRESHTEAELKKQSILAEYKRPGAAAGWRFLTGTEPNIKKLADTVGFGYRYDEKQQQYAHAAAIFVLTPDGRVSRYLYGIQYEPRTLRLALTEAGGGKVGGATDRLLLTCCRYDPNEGRYVLAAANVMRLGGFATALVVGVWLGTAWWKGARKHKNA
jgi:protein SCO1/2